jgi:hypothetical protein
MLFDMKRLTAKTVAVVVAAVGMVCATWRCISRRSKTKMTEKLKEHLILCEKAMQSAKPILGKHGLPSDRRTLTVIGLISLLIEYQESILLLEMHNYPGSASTLSRPIVESAYRALWINLPATDTEVKKFIEKDKIDLEFGEIATTLDNAYGMGDFFQDFKARAWKHLNSYTHGGMHQIGRRFVKDEVANNYREEEIYEMTTSVTTIILLTISFFLKRHGHADSGEQIQALLEIYGPQWTARSRRIRETS